MIGPCQTSLGGARPQCRGESRLRTVCHAFFFSQSYNAESARLKKWQALVGEKVPDLRGEGAKISVTLKVAAQSAESPPVEHEEF